MLSENELFLLCIADLLDLISFGFRKNDIFQGKPEAVFLSPQDRSAQYHKLTFSMMYFHSERFILPFSHDENVHGKATIIQKMNGDYEQKFPQARALYLYMYAHPGKKLNFMGGELALFREWDEKREQDHDILRYPIHDAFHRYMQELNRIYLNEPALWNDYTEDSFEWLDCQLEKECIYSFFRRSDEKTLLAVFNFSDKETKYTMSLGDAKELSLIIDTDDHRFGNQSIPDTAVSVKNGKAVVLLPPFSGRVYALE